MTNLMVVGSRGNDSYTNSRHPAVLNIYMHMYIYVYVYEYEYVYDIYMYLYMYPYLYMFSNFYTQSVTAKHPKHLQVLDIHARVGHPPGDVLVSAKNHPGGAREGCTPYVQGFVGTLRVRDHLRVGMRAQQYF